MGKIYKSVTELVGRTPLLEVQNIEEQLQLGAKVLVKLEYFNPAGSVKDRVALNMLEEAEKQGKIKPGATIIEPTSGNTGIGLASIAAAKGYKAVFVMPETMSIERRKLLLGYGAEIVLTEGAKGMKGAIERAEELQQERENAIVLGQFVNPANPKAHELTTGPEIWEDTEGNIVSSFISYLLLEKSFLPYRHENFSVSSIYSTCRLPYPFYSDIPLPAEPVSDSPERY